MGANFGVLPELRERPRDKRERAAAYAARALASLDKFLQENHIGDNYENHC
jgi:methylenetetrahydrofolate--tRNA-(uracil-5-)-methyltransferase